MSMPDVRSPPPQNPKPHLLQTLCEAYADPNLCDTGGEPFVCYGRLVEELEGVFGVRGLETKPECDVNSSVKAAQVGWFLVIPGSVLDLSTASAPRAREACVFFWWERSCRSSSGDCFGAGGGFETLEGVPRIRV